MVTIRQAPERVLCDDCLTLPASTHISSMRFDGVFLCEKCRYKLARLLAPQETTATPAPTRDDVAKMVAAKTDHLKDDLRKMVQSLLHAERVHTNKLVETTAENLRASIAATVPRSVPQGQALCQSSCMLSADSSGGIVHCVKTAGHADEHAGEFYGRAFYWENPA